MAIQSPQIQAGNAVTRTSAVTKSRDIPVATELHLPVYSPGNTTDRSFELAQDSLHIESGMDGIQFTMEKNPTIYLQTRNASLIIPDSDVLVIQDLNLSVKRGEHLLIAGPSGSGKVSCTFFLHPRVKHSKKQKQTQQIYLL